MILPERVFGSAGANWILSGAAIGPISLRTCLTSSFLQLVARLDAVHQGHEGVEPWPLMSCGMGATAASATLAWLTRALSTSAVPMR